MSNPTKKKALLPSLFTMKCPSCRQTHVFVNKSMFPLKELVMLKDQCEVCGQKMKSERNNGGGINYALTMILFILNLAWYVPIFNFKWEDNSPYYFLITSTVVVLLAQPYLMRLSRMIYLYLYVSFGDSTKA